MDKLDRKSVLGYVYILGGGPIAWANRKQKSVSLLTTEAEYMALSSCAKEGLWIKQLLKDISFNKYLGGNPNCVDIVESIRHQKDLFT